MQARLRKQSRPRDDDVHRFAKPRARLTLERDTHTAPREQPIQEAARDHADHNDRDAKEDDDPSEHGISL